jgi:hypothetical protein
MKKLFLLLLVPIFMVSVASSASALVIFEDNFDTENGGVGVLNYSGFDNWTVSDGTVDLIGNGYFDFFPGNGLYVDMDGSTNNAGIMTSGIYLAAGAYTLQFDLAGNQRNDAGEQVNVSVVMGSVFNNSYSLTRYDPFQTFTETIDVAADGNYFLQFEGVGGDNIGMLLDNVKIASVPEPATMLLVGIGFLGLAIGRKKFFKK